MVQDSVILKILRLCVISLGKAARASTVDLIVVLHMTRACTCRAMRIMGSAKASVLPLPVYETPTQSRPDRITGSPWIWIGVGVLILSRLRHFSVARGSRIARNEVIGGGRLSPVQSMRSLSRTVSCSASVRHAILHLQQQACAQASE